MVFLQQFLQSINSGLVDDFAIGRLLVILVSTVSFLSFPHQNFLEGIVNRIMNIDVIGSHAGLPTIDKLPR